MFLFCPFAGWARITELSDPDHPVRPVYHITLAVHCKAISVMKRILLIEDNQDIRENVVELLELAGYSLISAPDGELGLRLAQAELPDVILCDVMMPCLDGHQVFDGLRENSLTSSIPFVFMTSSVEKKEVQYALEKGASAYIKKPFEEKELIDTIRFCLERSE